VLQQHNAETAVVKRKLQRTGDLERHLPALSGALGQKARCIHEWLAQVDAGHVAAVGRRQKACRAADA